MVADKVDVGFDMVLIVSRSQSGGFIDNSIYLMTEILVTNAVYMVLQLPVAAYYRQRIFDLRSAVPLLWVVWVEVRHRNRRNGCVD